MRKNYRTRLRIERDMRIKSQRRAKELEAYSYDNAFTFRNFLRSLEKCKKGVFWKASVQNYYINNIIKLYADYINLNARKLPKPVTDKDIVIYERGKARTITPIHIKDRIIQKVLCDEVLVPVLSKKLIYDNGASLKDKGTEFSRERLMYYLHRTIKEYGSDFYVLCFDFKSYFDSVPHKTCRRILEKYFDDPDIINLTMDIIKAPYISKAKKNKDKEELSKLEKDECCGICLGSQVSQIMALIVPNELDHYIKDKKRMKYLRYMDDGIVIAKTKKELQTLYIEMCKICNNLGLHFNDKKTHIVKASKGFTFLKVRYYITPNGKIIRKLTRKGVVRMRRKLKKYKIKFDNDLMIIEDICASLDAWITHAKIAHSYQTVKSMLKLYKKLFYKEEVVNRVLQIDKREKYCWCGLTR